MQRCALHVALWSFINPKKSESNTEKLGANRLLYLVTVTLVPNILNVGKQVLSLRLHASSE